MVIGATESPAQRAARRAHVGLAPDRPVSRGGGGGVSRPGAPAPSAPVTRIVGGASSPTVFTKEGRTFIKEITTINGRTTVREIPTTARGALVTPTTRIVERREVLRVAAREAERVELRPTITPVAEGERFFVTSTGRAIRRFAGDKPPLRSREISKKEFEDIRTAGVGIAREEAKIRKAQEFGIAVGEELLRKQEAARLRRRIGEIGLVPVIGEETLRQFPVQRAVLRRIAAEREFVSKVGQISEKDIKAFEKLQLETGVAPGLTVAGAGFRPVTVTPSEIRAIKEAEEPLTKLEKRKEAQFLAREKRAREKGIIGIPERIVFGGLAGAATTFSFIRRRPAEAILTAGAFAISPAKIAAAVGTLLVGGRIAQRTLILKEPPITAIAGTAGEVLPFAAGAALGIGAVRGIRRGIQFRTKGRQIEIRRLKGIDITKAFIEEGKVIIPERALISEVFLRRLKKAKPPKPAEVIPLELKGARLGKLSPTAVESRIIKSFGLARVKKGKVTVEEVGFPEVKIGKTLVTAEPTPLKPLRTLPAQRFPVERFVERRGFERVRIQDVDLLVREDIGITETGRIIKGLRGKPKVKEFPFVEERISEVRPTKVRLRSDIQVRIDEAFKLPKGAEVITTERLLGKPIKKAQFPKELRLELFPRKVKRKPIKLGKRAELLLEEPKIDILERVRRQRVSDILEVRQEQIFDVKAILGTLPKTEVSPIISVKPLLKVERKIEFKPVSRLKLPTKPIFDVKPLVDVGTKPIAAVAAISLTIPKVDVAQDILFDFPRPPTPPEALPLPPRLPRAGLPLFPPLFPTGLLPRRRKVKIPRRGFVVTPTLFDITFFGDKLLKSLFKKERILTGFEAFRFGVKKKKKKKVKRKVKRKR